MTDFNSIMTAIGSIGFPIVCCLIMFQTSRETQKLHKEESDKWSEALANNTLALQKLTDMMEMEGRKDATGD